MDNKNDTSTVTDRSTLRRLGIVAAGLALGSILTYLFSRVRATRGERAVRPSLPEHIVDDRGTGQGRPGSCGSYAIARLKRAIKNWPSRWVGPWQKCPPGTRAWNSSMTM